MTEIPGRKGKSVLDSAARCSPMRTHPSACRSLPMITGFIESGETLGISLLGWVHWCSYCCNGWKHANRKLPKTCKPRHMFHLMFLETEGLGQSPAQKREEGRIDFISAKYGIWEEGAYRMLSYTTEKDGNMMIWYWQLLFLHQACHGLWPPARNEALLSSVEGGLPCLQEKKEKTEKKDKKSILESNNIEKCLRPLRHFCRDSWASEIKQIESILMLIGWRVCTLKATVRQLHGFSQAVIDR